MQRTHFTCKEDSTMAGAMLLAVLVASLCSSLLTLGLAVLVFAPASRAEPNPQATVPMIRTERLELVDPGGAVLAWLGKTEDGSVGLAFPGQADPPRAVIGRAEDGTPLLALTNPQGAGILLGTDSRWGSFGWVIWDAAGQTRLGASMIGDDQGLLTFVDSNKQTRILLAQRPDNTATVEIMDQSGQIVWKAP
jgi:hypothetical protein